MNQEDASFSRMLGVSPASPLRCLVPVWPLLPSKGADGWIWEQLEVLVSAPFLSSRKWAALGEQMISGTPCGGGRVVYSMWRERAAFSSTTSFGGGMSVPNSGGTNTPNVMPSILVSLVIKVTVGFCLPVLCLSSQIIQKLGRERVADQISDLLENYRALPSLFKWQLHSCARATYRIPRLHPHDENQPPSWRLCAWLPGRKPSFSDKTTSSSLRTLMRWLLLPSAPSHCWVPLQSGRQPVFTGQPGRQGYWLSFSPGSPTRSASHPENHFLLN